MFSWKKIKKPVVALSPMADYTDSPFSIICRRLGADIIYREMVSAEAVVRENEKTLKMAEFLGSERPIILQIFGKKPEIMAKAARILEKKFHPDGIDINMGCPAKKIAGDFNGASLMREPELAAAIIKAVKFAVSVPISVKTRTGWEREAEIISFAKVVEKAGADALAIHGRTKKMGYSGKANWKIIGEAKKCAKIPVLANGDIVDYESFSSALKASGADGVLIGRGALGNPWIFRQIKRRGYGRPSAAEIKKIIQEHLKLHLARYGERGIISFRKHLAAYFSGAAGAKKIRALAVKINSSEDVEKILALRPGA